MQSLWNSEEAGPRQNDPLALNAYLCQLIGETDATAGYRRALCSVKADGQNLFGETETQLSLASASCSKNGRCGCHQISFQQETLLKLVRSSPLAAEAQDSALQLSLACPSAKTPPRDALLHAAIPARFAAQVTADALLALACHAHCEALCQELFEGRVLLAPYAPAGIERARAVAQLIQGKDLSNVEGILIRKAGLIAFHDEAEGCYENALKLANQAAACFEGKVQQTEPSAEKLSLADVAELRRVVSQRRGHATIAHWDASPSALAFAAESQSNGAPLIPHCSATDGDHETSLGDDSAPLHVAWPGHGLFSFACSSSGATSKGVGTSRLAHAIQLARASGGWNGLPQEFEIRGCGGKNGLLQGKIALVSGSAAGIGLATATTLAEAGACVIGADINPEIGQIMSEIGALGVTVDLTHEDQIKALIERIVRSYGGLDIVVSNAGIFTAGAYLEDMEQQNWERSLAVNLTSHQVLMKHAIPYVKKGIDPTIIFIGSRNVNAPGAGAASYSCAKAGLTQLCRVAALELAPLGVRVNIIHPDAVFDTKLWTKEALERSAERYGLTVEQYKKRNLMKTEITSRSVGNSVVALASNAFAKTTGAQIPVDGGNDRII